MDPDYQIFPPPLPPSRSRSQLSRSGHHSLQPANIIGPSHVLPSYPSSALHHYYPSTTSPIPNPAHILTPSHTFPLHSHMDQLLSHQLLPSASQFHVPSLRQTPSSPSQIQPNDQNIMNSNDFPTHAASLSPLAFSHPLTPHVLYNNTHLPASPVIMAPQPIPLPANPILPPVLRSPTHIPTPTPFLIISRLLFLTLNQFYLQLKTFPYFLENMTGDPGMLRSVP